MDLTTKIQIKLLFSNFKFFFLQMLKHSSEKSSVFKTPKGLTQVHKLYHITRFFESCSLRPIVLLALNLIKSYNLEIKDN